MPKSLGISQPAFPDSEAVRARRAISFVFLLNGLSFCSILPRFPEIVANLQITNIELGAAVALGPLGGLGAGMFAARIMRRFRSGPTAVGAQICATTAQFLIFVAPSWAMLALGFILAAGFDAVTDIAQNSHGMRVERRYGRSIMNSYHGFWSLGAVLGGIVGSLCAQFGVPLWVQGAVGVVAYAAAGLVNYRGLLPGADNSEKDAIAGEELSAPVAAHPDSGEGPTAPEGNRDSLAGPSPASAQVAPVPNVESSDDASHARNSSQRAHQPWLTLVALGMLLVCAGSSEDAGNTWGALFMDSTFDVSPFVAGLAFVALQGTQMTARFLGDRIVDALGDRATARLGAAIGATGMSLAMLAPHPVTALLGFAATGWGVATLFPAAFRAGDNMSGLAPGIGITFVGWFSRIGFFIAPPLVGALADAFTLRYVLWLVPLYACGIFLFSGALEGKQRESRGG